jgi:uncharacterized protein (TIGR02300 family)
LADSEVNTVSDKAAIKLERGAKRTCQNPECGSRFYDLNRDPIICPICNTAFVIATQPASEIPVRSFARPYKKPPPFVPNEPKQKVPTEDVEQIALENEEDTAPAEEDDTLIEEVDEDSPDMAGIVDAPEDNDKQ